VVVRIKVDEDLPLEVARIFVEHGHDAVTVVAQGWQGLTDELLWPRVQNERRWLVTAGKGFADLRHYSPAADAGVLLLRPAEENRRAYVRFARTAAERLDFNNLAGSLIVMTPRGIRIRRP
jgi:predicted nuclease of predicted toxin-antitoxin system